MADSLIRIFSDNASLNKIRTGTPARTFVTNENLGKVFASESRPSKQLQLSKGELRKTFLSNISTAIQTTPMRPVFATEKSVKTISKPKVEIYIDREESLDDSGFDAEQLQFTKPQVDHNRDLYSVLDAEDFNIAVFEDPSEEERRFQTPEPIIDNSFAMEELDSISDIEFKNDDDSFTFTPINIDIASSDDDEYGIL